MRLTFYSDYSLRLLMYAALKPDALITIHDVAEAYGISKNHLTKVAFDLGRAGFVETVRGRNGGLRLAKKPEEIGLGDVLRITESRSVLVECFNPKTNSCVISAPCRLKGVLARALKAWFAVLDEYTLADLTDKNAGLSRILMTA
ncbi:MAG TPA: Rrf2 family transcriptional regulator [Rhizomicrobium sp.]|jgi:Rrf2 family nitric oxide-sensitive transcriptional repressor|nr:Rrf2 family transcriptional regulator [Rhizomicrobium sp.]